MKRRWHVFRAPGDEEQPLPIADSPWHAGRDVRIPEEHWLKLLDFARSIDKGGADALETASFLEEDDARRFDRGLRVFDLLGQMIERLPTAPPLTPETDDEILENYVPDEHVRMLKAVRAVVGEALRTGQPFESWKE